MQQAPDFGGLLFCVFLWQQMKIISPKLKPQG